MTNSTAETRTITYPALKQARKKSSQTKRPPPKASLSEWATFVLIAAVGAALSATVVWTVLSWQTLHRHGTVLAVDAQARSLTVRSRESGGRNTYAWDEHTRFFDGDKPAGPEVLSPGAHVVVHYGGGLDVTPTAVRITVKRSATGPESRAGAQ